MEKRLVVAIKHLREADPVINSLVQQHGPCTLFDDDGLLHRPKFHVMAWAIINQQLSVQSARSIENKLLARLPGDSFEPEEILALKQPELAACGLSRQKIRYLVTLSEAVVSEQLLLEELDDMDNESVASILTELPGIGPWTVDMFLIFSLGRLDVLPLGDLALRKSIALHYELDEKARPEKYHAVAEKWHPYETIASWYLWLAVD